MDKVVGGDEVKHLASDGVSRHMGAWTSFRVRLTPLSGSVSQRPLLETRMKVRRYMES